MNAAYRLSLGGTELHSCAVGTHGSGCALEDVLLHYHEHVGISLWPGVCFLWLL